MLHFKVNNKEIFKVVQQTKNVIRLLLQRKWKCVYMVIKWKNLQIMTEIALC